MDVLRVEQMFKDITPQEAWSGVKPSVEDFIVWGSLAYAHVPDEKRSDKSVACFLLGFSEESKGYRLYNPTTKKVITSRDVVFEGTKGWNWEEDEEHQKEAELTWNDDGTFEESEEENNDDGGDVGAGNSGDEAEQPGEATTENQAGQNMGVREGRVRRLPRYLNDCVTFAEVENAEDEVNMVEVNATDPSTFEEAEKDTKWIEAMDEEIHSIEKNQTWKLCSLPDGAKCIGVK